MKVMCVIDNAAAQSSLFWGEHGFSCLVETAAGRVLMDTGRSGDVLLHNLSELDVPPASLTALVLSHSHQDHTGGLPRLLEQVRGIPLFGGSHLFQPRFICKSGKCRPSGMPIPEERMREAVDLRLSAEPVEIVPGVWTTGEISPRLEPEGRSSSQVIPSAGGWAPDPYLDDMSLVLQTGQGLVVVCGCCHAGLLNTLAQVRREFGGPVAAIIGGTHVRDSDAAVYEHIAQVLRDQYGSPDLYVNHCTGLDAYMALSRAFGGRLHPCPAGTALEFN